MRHPPLFLASARLIGDFGGKVVLSLAASAVAAAILAAQPEHRAARPPVALAPGWTSPVAADGKIRERHHDAVSNDASVDRAAVGGLVTPAAFAMPMRTAWPDGVFQITRQNAGNVAPAQTAPTASLPAVRKAPTPQERPRLAQGTPAEKPRLAELPARIEPAVSRAAEAAEPSTIARVGDAVTNAIGTVGAAGIWTLSQASSLLPRL